MNYIYIDFEWDEAKSAECLRLRGFDFEFASRAFRDPNCHIRRDQRRDYGENRLQLLGRIEKRVFAVAYTLRGNGIRIIYSAQSKLSGGEVV